MKLQSQITYEDSIDLPSVSDAEFRILARNHRNFLKQPLTLSMFVPCGDDGEVLEEPQPIYHKDSFDDCEDYDYDQTECDTYRKAKERCLFEGFQVCNCNNEIAVRKEEVLPILSSEMSNLTIESLIKNNLTLTQSAINQITTTR